MEENDGEGDEFCVECEDQSPEIVCLGCSNEQYCRPCWGAIHRHGKRATHEIEPMLRNIVPRLPTELELPDNTHAREMSSDMMEEESSHHSKASDSSVGMKDMMSENRVKERQYSFVTSRGRHSSPGDMTSLKNLVENCRYVPMRLSARERKLLTVLMSALEISEYTDHVDVLRRWDKATIALEQLEMMLGYVLGLAIAGDVGGGEKLVLATMKVDEESAKLENDNTAGSTARKMDYSGGGGSSSTFNGSKGRKKNIPPLFWHYASFFQDVFEAGRRHKISNPHHMQSNYGKMMFMLQDSQAAFTRAEGDEFSLVKDLEMITPFLEKWDAIQLLKDPRIVIATSCTDENERETARRELIEEYSTDAMPSEDTERVLLRELLMDNFNAKSQTNPLWSLKISPSFGVGVGQSLLGGNSFGFSSYGTSYGEMGYAGVRETKGGAKLNHSHSMQFTFVLQSLCLWTEAMKCTYRLWMAADGDLLNGKASYRLLNTGQGLNRVQQCPSVSKEMRKVLMATKGVCEENWVGLSVVHLGDRDVPNALTFIDKYAQIPGMISHVASAVDAVAELNRDPNVKIYIDCVLDGEKHARMNILTDFFKHAFDGDGDDGGSCIDGRITSCWNWCSKIASKPYYRLFLLSGFYGFNG